MIHLIPATVSQVDGAAYPFGDTLIMLGARTTRIGFKNLSGVTVTGIDLTVPATDSYGVLFSNCQNFRLTWSRISGGNIGISVGVKCSDFEIDNNLVTGSGFAGIMCKDDGAKRGEFTMRNVRIHHNEVSETGAEGMYIGNSAYIKGHDLEEVSIYKNRFRNTGWEAIQVGCAKGCNIYDNVIDNAGTKGTQFQGNGIQLGEGTTALCYGNIIRGTSGNGIISLGVNCTIYENVILNAGDNGIFVDDRVPMGTWTKIFRNTIVSPVVDCVKIYANNGILNYVENNELVAPGSFNARAADPFVNSGPQVITKAKNNFTTIDPALALFLIGKYSA